MQVDGRPEVSMPNWDNHRLVRVKQAQPAENCVQDETDAQSRKYEAVSTGMRRAAIILDAGAPDSFPTYSVSSAFDEFKRSWLVDRSVGFRGDLRPYSPSLAKRRR